MSHVFFVSGFQISTCLSNITTFTILTFDFVNAHSLSLGHRFEEKPILLKHINNRPLPELLIWEKIFIYKYKEVSINFEMPQFSDLYKLMDADSDRQKALVTGQSNSSRR